MWEKHITLIDTIGSVVLGGMLYVVSMIGVLHDIVMQSRDFFTLICAAGMAVGMALAGFGLWRNYLTHRAPKQHTAPATLETAYEEISHVW